MLLPWSRLLGPRQIDSTTAGPHPSVAWRERSSLWEIVSGWLACRTLWEMMSFCLSSLRWQLGLVYGACIVRQIMKIYNWKESYLTLLQFILFPEMVRRLWQTWHFAHITHTHIIPNTAHSSSILLKHSYFSPNYLSLSYSLSFSVPLFPHLTDRLVCVCWGKHWSNKNTLIEVRTTLSHTHGHLLVTLSQLEANSWPWRVTVCLNQTRVAFLQFKLFPEMVLGRLS